MRLADKLARACLILAAQTGLGLKHFLVLHGEFDVCEQRTAADDIKMWASDSCCRPRVCSDEQETEEKLTGADAQ